MFLFVFLNILLTLADQSVSSAGYDQEAVLSASRGETAMLKTEQVSDP